MSAHDQKVTQITACFHCGEECREETVTSADKSFCCVGCKTVYEILNESGLCEYYDIESHPGITQREAVRKGKFAFLDNDDIASRLVHFSNGSQTHVTFYLPQMHCSSCIWLLEQLPKLSKGVISSKVDFLKKEVTVIFEPAKISLRTLAELLTNIGYEPHISLNDIEGKKVRKYDRSRIYKIGIAGFCFGNIMMLSFPEYLSDGDVDPALKHLFSLLNVALSLPVFFYCASEFFVSSYKSLRQKFLNIDAPIALAIVITFGRSLYEIVTNTGAGYLDSMSGIVFFMLLGRFFQDKTYQTLTFDRDYKSYLPIAVTVLQNDRETQKPVSDLRKGDRIRIHSHEIVPADAILFMGRALIDYSFVTGESTPMEKTIGEIIYAGGRQTGGSIELEVVKNVSQSYLTKLWNDDAFGKKDTQEKKVSFVHAVSRYFTYILFTLVIATAIYWTAHDSSRTWSAVTAMLIVACPCALLLSATFTNGNMLSRLQRSQFYVKNANVLERIAAADTIVFDKTGTLSIQGESGVTFEGGALSDYEKKLVRTIARQSNHPLSKAVAKFLPESLPLRVQGYYEQKGKGSSAVVDNHEVKLGSAEFVTGHAADSDGRGSRVYVSVNNEVLGYFSVRTMYREGLETLIGQLKTYHLALISGDNNTEEAYLRGVFGPHATLHFGVDPHAKLDFIRRLQSMGHRVIMVGDGLNDAGALQQSDVGITVSDDINNFSPACDAILHGSNFGKLKRLLDYCSGEKKIIYGSFILSVIYNIAGLYYAMRGEMSPVIAAVLMPLSSVTIVSYTTLVSGWLYRKILKR